MCSKLIRRSVKDMKLTEHFWKPQVILWFRVRLNTLRTGDADLRFYITTVQDGWRKSAFLTCACFPCTIHLIMQYIEPVSEWSCWRMFIETWPYSELNFRHALPLYRDRRFATLQRTLFIYLFNKYISLYFCPMGCAMGTIGSSTQYNSHDRLLIFINVE